MNKLYNLKEVIIPKKAELIWCNKENKSNTKAVFIKTFNIDKIPKDTNIYIACETRYYLYVNNDTVVLEGGLFRESLKGCSYIDKVDLKAFLQIGENNITILVDYYGNEGRNNVDSKNPCLLYFCASLNIYSDATTKSIEDTTYYTPKEERPAYLYGGDNLGYDANVKINHDNIESYATIVDNCCFKTLYERPIPNFCFSDVTESCYDKIDDYNYSVNLPMGMWVYPCLSCTAIQEDTIIKIKSDRYLVNGGPGDEKNSYNGQYIEYKCIVGENKFNSIISFFAEQLIITTNKPIENINFSYIKTSYDTKVTGTFICDDKNVNALVKKATNTLLVCMRDNFMDCPDRERGQWIGDVSVQVPQSMFLLDDKAKCLVKKCISDFINLRQGDVLVGNVPGANFGELPSQSLNAISEIGLISNYYKYTGDIDALEVSFKPMINYLKLWDMNEDGLVKSRSGNWKWFDHLYNVDEDVLENAWYYSALKFSLKVANIIGNCKYNEFLKERITSIEKTFHDKYFKGEYYASKDFVDDRANAIAVLSGLAKSEHYPSIRKILLSVFNSTVYMENYVLIALCEMGYIKDAYNRMSARYYNLAVNENSTLWEDFYILGTKNHAWSGAPATLAFKYFMGIDTYDGFNTYTVNPCEGLFKKMKCTFLQQNKKITLCYDDETKELIKL